MPLYVRCNKSSFNVYRKQKHNLWATFYLFTLFNEKVPTEGYMVLVIYVHRVSFLHYRSFQCVLLVTQK